MQLSSVLQCLKVCPSAAGVDGQGHGWRRAHAAGRRRRRGRHRDSLLLSLGAELHHSPLLAVQGGVGLDRAAARALHGRLHAVRRRLPAQRGRGARQTQPGLVDAPAERRDEPGELPRHHRPDRRRNVHRRHPHQLPHDVHPQRRGGHWPAEDRTELPAWLVPRRRRRRHSLRPAALRHRHQRREYGAGALLHSRSSHANMHPARAFKLSVWLARAFNCLYGLDRPLSCLYGLRAPLSCLYGLDRPLSCLYGLRAPLSCMYGLGRPLSCLYGLRASLSCLYGLGRL